MGTHTRSSFPEHPFPSVRHEPFRVTKFWNIGQSMMCFTPSFVIQWRDLATLAAYGADEVSAWTLQLRLIIRFCIVVSFILRYSAASMINAEPASSFGSKADDRPRVPLGSSKVLFV